MDRHDAIRARPAEIIAGPAAMLRFAYVATDSDGNASPRETTDVGVQGLAWFPVVTKFRITDRNAKIKWDGNQPGPAEKIREKIEPFVWKFSDLTDRMA